MARLVKYWSDDTASVPVTNVYYRSSWQDSTPWTVIPNCYCVSASKTTGRAISTARLVFEYGYIQEAGSSTFAVVSPLSLQGNWVKVEWTPNSGTNNFDFAVANSAERIAVEGDLEAGQRVRQLDDGVIYDWNGTIWTPSGDSATAGLETWYGIISDDERQQAGETNGVATGTQYLNCVGPEWLLTRKQITTTTIEETAGATTSEIKIGIPFNEFRGDYDNQQQNAGNQSNVPDIGGVQIFAKDLSNPRKWNSKDIIEHLLKYHEPLDYGSSPPAGAMTFTLSAANNNLLSWYEPINVVTHGRTVWDILNEVVPANRGIFWYLTVDETNDEFVINVDSLLPTGITLPVTGTAVAANSNPVDWNYDEDSGVRSSDHTDSIQRQYSKITVEGARRGCVCSLGVTSGELVADWTAGDLTDYIAAASGELFYTKLNNNSDKIRANDSKRSHDEVLRRVFTHFRLDPDWDGRAKDGISSTTSATSFVLRAHDRLAQDVTLAGGSFITEAGDPLTEEDGVTELSPEVDVAGYVLSSSWWVDGIRVENYLPIYKGYDYSNPTSPVNNLPADSVPEFRRPFTTTAMMDSDTETLDTAVREYVDSLATAAFYETSTRGAGLGFNGRMHPMRNAPGVIIDSSAPPHVFGHGTYTPTPVAPTNYETALDYRLHSSTVYLTFPEHVRVTIPGSPVASHNHESELLIRIGERAHCDLLLSDTIVGLNGGAVTRATASAYIRDDRQILRDLAGMAWEWYRTPRKATTLSTGFVTSQALIGELVLTEGFVGTVNSVVSEVAWDFTRGGTRIKTQFAELDFGGLV